jgi:hypothetical protein
MKWLLACVGAVLVASPAMADTTRTYQVQPFDRIAVSEAIELQAQVGEPLSVTATTDKEDFSGLIVEVEAGSLVVRRVPQRLHFGWPRDSHYKVTVTVPELHGISASSSAAADVTGPVSANAVLGASSSARLQVAEVRGDKVTAVASSSGRLTLGTVHGKAISVQAASSGQVRVGELQSPQVGIRASSSGRVEASGACDALDASASSSGTIRVSGLRCRDLTVDASSGGVVDAFASARATVRASSGARVSVAGKPPQFETHESSGASVRATN